VRRSRPTVRWAFFPNLALIDEAKKGHFPINNNDASRASPTSTAIHEIRSLTTNATNNQPTMAALGRGMFPTTDEQWRTGRASLSFSLSVGRE
jgi:hypothetical protein